MEVKIVEKKKLLIDYDEDTKEIIFYEVSQDGCQKIAIKVPLSLYQKQGPDQAERLMGETVFTFFDSWANIKMGLREYVQEAKKSLASRLDSLRIRALDGEATAQYYFAIECLTSGIKNRSASQIEDADSWLRKSAASGFEDAVEYLAKNWEREKAFALRSISD
jgi:hypothetical protein